MDEAKKRRWLVVSFFLVISLLFCGFIYSAITGPRYWQSRQQLERAALKKDKKKSSQQEEIDIALTAGQIKTVGNIKMIYKGLENDKICIDVIIPEFDPQMAHRHEISTNEANKALKLGGQSFLLISARDTRLHLQKIK
jgi:hypothetical protein